MFTRLTVLDFTGKKLALWFIAHEFVVGHCPPPTSTSRPPDVIHVIGVPSPSLFFFLRSSASVCYTERKSKDKNRWRPGNEAEGCRQAVVTVVLTGSLKLSNLR